MLDKAGISNSTEAEVNAFMVLYYAKITLIDDYIGRIIQALEKKGLLANTWIIYSADHGEMLGDHGLRSKRVFYDGALRIPCVIRPPRGTRGWKSVALTDQHDLAASMLEIAGAGPLEDSDGRSIIPKILVGADGPDAQKGKDVVFSEVTGLSMACDGPYRLTIDSMTREPVEMFDLENDPDEFRNVVNEPSLEPIRAGLLKKLNNRLLSRVDEEKFELFRTKHTEFSLPEWLKK